VTAGLVDRRIGLLFATFLTLLAIAGLRSVQIGVLKGGKLSSAAATQQIRTLTVPAQRGSITVRHAVPRQGPGPHGGEDRSDPRRPRGRARQEARAP
jgi:hypothetical protein